MKKLLEILLYLLLILFPFGVLTRITPIPNVSFYAHDIVVVGVFLLLFLFLIKKRINLFSSKLTIPMLVFEGYFLFSLLVNYKTLGPDQFFISLLYSLRLILYSSILFALKILDRKFINRFKTGMLLSGLTFIIIGFIQFVFYPNLRNLYYLGWDEHLSRLFSTFLDPNFAGAFIVLYIIFVLGLVGKKMKFIKKILFFVVVLISISALAITYSRSALIMFVVAIFSFLFFSKKIKWAILLIAAVFISYILIPTNFSLENTNLLRTASINARETEIAKAGKIFLDHPIFGVGFNSYRYAREKYGYSSPALYQDHAGAGVPNIYMFILATTGIVGMIVFLYFVSIPLRESIFNIKANNDLMINAVVVASIISLLIEGLFENGFFYSFIMIWVFLILGIMDYMKR